MERGAGSGERGVVDVSGFAITLLTNLHSLAEAF